ncbi:hypothetical protein BDQ17DRAFT_1359313 [Cyathus striatus]|nr:hypothetical protein BDQ17DRAFT_1359313 [Cyathus striatus]
MMLVTDHPNGPGFEDGPISFEHYKRAVLRAAPSRFAIDYSYGMRICPIISPDRRSVLSRESVSEYEVWRRWEDCLWFQDTLELEYKRAARERKLRLQQGKGVKTFEGFYKQDMASSWDSLPPGPDPSSVAQDIHEIVPRLTKKGTIFRASQATIQQRQAEIEAMVGTLFREDMPTLIQEIRSDRVVTDFFGYWRRDNDLVEKQKKGKTPRSSITSSVFSSYFSSSNLSLPDDPNIRPGMHPLPRSPDNGSPVKSTASSSTGRPHSVASSGITERFLYPQVLVAVVNRSQRRRRPLSTTSSDSSSSRSDGSSDTCSLSSTPVIADEFPIVFGYNPHHQADPNDRPMSVLETLPEDGLYAEPHLKSPSTNKRISRANRQLVDSLPGKDDNNSTPMQSSQRGLRESWQTTMSTATILEGLNLYIPDSDSPAGRPYRASTASIATFMTTDSATAVIRGNLPSQTPCNGRPRASVPVSLSDYDIWSDIDEEIAIIDEFPRPASYTPDAPDSRPETPMGNVLTYNTVDQLSSLVTSVPASPVTSTFSNPYSISTTSECSTKDGLLSIKVAHNNAIIMLRVPCSVTFNELRQRIYNKFVGQEGVPLSHNFTVALVLPDLVSSNSSQGRTHSTSVTSVAERVEMKCINSQSEWDQIVGVSGNNKLTLHILESPS